MTHEQKDQKHLQECRNQAERENAQKQEQVTVEQESLVLDHGDEKTKPWYKDMIRIYSFPFKVIGYVFRKIICIMAYWHYITVPLCVIFVGSSGGGANSTGLSREAFFMTNIIAYLFAVVVLPWITRLRKKVNTKKYNFIVGILALAVMLITWVGFFTINDKVEEEHRKQARRDYITRTIESGEKVDLYTMEETHFFDDEVNRLKKEGCIIKYPEPILHLHGEELEKFLDTLKSPTKRK